MPRQTAKDRPGDRRFASVQAVATMYDVDPVTVRRWIASGLVRGYRVGERLIQARPERGRGQGRAGDPGRGTLDLRPGPRRWRGRFAWPPETGRTCPRLCLGGHRCCPVRRRGEPPPPRAGLAAQGRAVTSCRGPGRCCAARSDPLRCSCPAGPVRPCGADVGAGRWLAVCQAQAQRAAWVRAPCGAAGHQRAGGGPRRPGRAPAGPTPACPWRLASGAIGRGRWPARSRPWARPGCS